MHHTACNNVRLLRKQDSQVSTVEEHVRATVTPDALSAGLESESAMQFMGAVDANRRYIKIITLDPRKRVLQLFTWTTSKFYSVQNAQTAFSMGWLLDNIAALVISHGYCNVTLCWAQVLVHINMWSLPNQTRKMCCLTNVTVNCLRTQHVTLKCCSRLLAHNFRRNCYCIMFPFNCQGIARTQSPTTKNCTPEFPTFGGIADFSQAKCNALASTWAACLRDHKQPAPGKLIRGCQLGSYEETVLWKLMVHWKHKHLCGVDVTCLHYSTCMPDSLHIVYI